MTAPALQANEDAQLAAQPSGAGTGAVLHERKFSRFWMAGSLLVAGTVLTVALSQYMAQQFRQRTQLVFIHQGDALLGKIQNELQLVLEHLQGFVSLYAASKSVERDEFHTYVTRSQALAQLPGLIAVNYVERVVPEARAAFEERVRMDHSLAPEGYPAFAIHPDPRPGEEAYVVTYLEPYGSNQVVHGFNANTDPVRRLALDSARDSGAMAVTAPIDLVQLQEGRHGLIFVLPVYRNGASQETVADRQAALAGFIVGVFKTSELFTKMLGQETDQFIDVEVFDGPVLTEEHLLFDRDPVLRIYDAAAPGSFQTIEALPIGGRLWTVSLATRPGFGWDPVRSYLPTGILVIGTLFNLLLAGLVFSLSFSKTQALRLAKDMTKTLRESEERYRQIVDSAPDPIVILTPAGFIDSVNPAAERLSGYRREELLGKHLGAVGMLTPGALGLALKEFTLVIAGQTRPPQEYEMTAKGGQRLVMEAHAQGLRAKQKIFGIQIIMRDVTTRRTGIEAEAERRRELQDRSQEIEEHNRQLRRQEQVMHSLLEDMQAAKARLEERDKMLQDANTRLRDLSVLKDEFVAKVSHELRTPLTSIKEGLNLLMDNALGQTNPEQQDFLKTMDQDIDRLTELISNMLDIAKIEGGGMRLRRDRLDLRDAVLASRRSLQQLLGGRALTVECPEGLMVFGDQNRLIQVFNNLLSNAIKFTPAEGAITVQGRSCDGLVTVAVTDSGTGIAADDVPKLFKKFAQVGTFDANRPRGTGLGLVVCKELVEMHGGTIEVSSQPGRGSTFTMQLPAYTDAFALQESFEDLAGPALAGGHVIALVAINAAEMLRETPPAVAGAMLQTLEQDIRRHLHRGDALLIIGDRWVVILALCSPDGPRAIVRRLRGALASYELRYGAALHPADGANAAALFAHASANLDAGLAAPAATAPEPMKERPT